MSDTRTMNINLGLKIEVQTPSNLSDKEVLDLIFQAAEGQGDPRYGANLLANLNFYVQDRLQENLTSMNTSLKIGSCSIQPHPDGDTRTPRQRALDYAKTPEFTGS